LKPVALSVYRRKWNPPTQTFHDKFPINFSRGIATGYITLIDRKFNNYGILCNTDLIHIDYLFRIIDLHGIYPLPRMDQLKVKWQNLIVHGLQSRTPNTAFQYRSLGILAISHQ